MSYLGTRLGACRHIVQGIVLASVLVGSAGVAGIAGQAGEARALDEGLYCDYSLDAPDEFSNEAAGAGCVTVSNNPAGTLRLARLVVAPGWLATVRSDGTGSDPNRIEVRFDNPTTGVKRVVRIEPGKTIVK